MKDKETQKILSEGEELKQMVKGTGWQIAKRKLLERVMALANIENIDLNKDPVAVAQELKASREAIKVLMGWLSDIEGEVHRHDYQSKVMTEYTNRVVISQFTD